MKDPFSTRKARSTDSMNVAGAYLAWPELAKKGAAIEPEIRKGKFRKVYVLAMGGSAAAGDIVAGWLHSSRGVEVEVCKGVMPFDDLKGCLVMVCSASGNTEETIAMMESARNTGATLVSMSHDGKLSVRSRALGVPHVQMPEILAPRYVLPFMVFASVRMVDSALGFDSSEEIKETIGSMRNLKSRIGPSVPLERNWSKKLAIRVMEKTPSIYGTRVTRGPGIRFKNEINENSKRHAYYEEMPELFHNEVQAWGDEKDRFFPLFLRDKAETKRESRLADAFFKILASMGMNPESVRGSGDSLLSRLMTMVYQLELASYYAAVGAGRDPFPTSMIVRLKETRG